MCRIRYAFGLAWIVSALSPDASAQTVAPHAVQIRYVAPESCPDRTTFERRVRARTQAGSLEIEPSGGPREYEIRIQPSHDGVLGRIEIRDADGSSTTREIEAGSCDEAADALALIAALTLDAARPPAAATHLPAPAPARKVDRTPAMAAHTRRTLWFEFSTEALLVSGISPDPAVAVQLAGGVLAENVARGIGMRAGARFAPSQSFDDENGAASTRWRTAFITACANVLANGESSLGICGDFEYGELAAAGYDTLNPRSAERPWSAVGPGLTGDWHGLAPLFVRAGLEGVFPLVRDRFLLADSVIYRVPAFALRGHVGIGARF